MEFNDWYNETRLDGDNEELEELINIHMGSIHGNTLRSWLEAAFEAGKESNAPL